MIEDIRYLIVFAKVAELGSLTKAAEAMALSVPTVSAHLARLEKNLDAALLYRNSRKLSLTQDGTRLLETARAMLDLYEKGVIEFAQRAVSTASRLRISIPALFINNPTFMAQLGAFVQGHPEIDLEIECRDRRSDLIEEGIDVAFRIGELPDSSLKAKRLFEFSRVVVASPGLLARHPPLKHPRELAALPWIGLIMRPNQRSFQHPSGERQEVKYQPRLRLDNIEAAYRMARLGAGLSVPPRFLAQDDLNAGSMTEVLPEWSLSPMEVYAVWPPNMSSSSAAYTLIKAMHDALGPRAG